MLKINRIALENFLNIKKCDLDTDAKVILISGPNGSGKSAVLEAIRTILSSKKRAEKYNEYIRQGQSRATIHLEAVVNGKPATFDVEMNLKKGAAFGLTIEYDGKEYKNTEAQDLLGTFDFDYYSDLILTMQGDQDITELSPTARSVYLQRLLNFDFEKQKTKVRADIDDILVKRSDLRKDLATKQALVERETKMIEAVIDPGLYDSTTETTKLFELEGEFQKTEERRREFSKVVEEKSVLVEKKLRLEAEVTRLENQIADAERSGEKLRSMAEEHDRLRGEVDGMDDRIDDLARRVKNTEEALQNSSVSLKTHEDLLVEFKSILSEAKRSADLIDRGTCPTCGQATDQHSDEIVEDLRTKFLKHFDRPAEQWRPKTVRELAETIEMDVKDKEETVNLTRAHRDGFQKNLNESKVAHATEVSRKQDLIEMRAVLKAKMVEFPSIPNTDGWSSSRDEKKKLISDISGQIDILKKKMIEFEDEDTGWMEDEMKSFREKVLKKAELKRKAEEVIKKNKEAEEEIQKLTDEIVEVRLQMGLLDKDEASKNEALKIFEKDLPNYMIVKTCASLQDEMNDFIHAIFPQYDVKLIQGRGGTIFNYTKDRTIDEEVSNAWISAKMSSGFERSMLTMAFKQSLCKLYDLDICVLDECDRSADDDSSDKLFEQILGDDTWSQVWVITHKKSTCQSIMDGQDDCKIFIAKHGNFIETDSPFED